MFTGNIGRGDIAEVFREDGVSRHTGTAYNPIYCTPSPTCTPLAGSNSIQTIRQFSPRIGDTLWSAENIGGTRTLPHGWNLSLDLYVGRIWDAFRSPNINSPLNGNPTGPRPFGPNLNILQVQNSGQDKINAVFFGVEQHTYKYVQFFFGGVHVNIFGNDDNNTLASPQSVYSDAGEYARRSGQTLWNLFGNGTLNLPRKVQLSTNFNAGGDSHYNITTGFDNNGDGRLQRPPPVRRPRHTRRHPDSLRPPHLAIHRHLRQQRLPPQRGRPPLELPPRRQPPARLHPHPQPQGRPPANPHPQHPLLERPQPPQRHQHRRRPQLPPLRRPLRRRQRPPHRSRSPLQLLSRRKPSNPLQTVTVLPLPLPLPFAFCLLPPCLCAFAFACLFALCPSLNAERHSGAARISAVVFCFRRCSCPETNQPLTNCHQLNPALTLQNHPLRIPLHHRPPLHTQITQQSRPRRPQPKHPILHHRLPRPHRIEEVMKMVIAVAIPLRSPIALHHLRRHHPSDVPPATCCYKPS